MSILKSSDGISIDYVVDDFTDPWRTPRKLVLLHSAMGCKDRFFSWMPGLLRHFRVLRIDLRGHGRTEVPSPSHELSIDRLKRDILEVMDATDFEAAHFAGASAGGYLAMRLAMDLPQRVQSLSLFGSTPGFKGGQAPKWIPLIKAKGFRTFLADTISDRFPIGQCDPKLVDWFLDQAGASDIEFVPRFIALMDQQDWSAELAKIRCPTLLVIPGAGKIGDYAGFERMRRTIPDIEVVTYEGAPHNVWDFMADRCVADVRRFIDSRFGAERIGTGA